MTRPEVDLQRDEFSTHEFMYSTRKLGIQGGTSGCESGGDRLGGYSGDGYLQVAREPQLTTAAAGLAGPAQPETGSHARTGHTEHRNREMPRQASIIASAIILASPERVWEIACDQPPPRMGGKHAPDDPHRRAPPGPAQPLKNSPG